MNDTVVFIPAWNEEDNLPAVLDELRGRDPGRGRARRRRRVDRPHGRGRPRARRRRCISLGANLGLRVGIAAGYRGPSTTTTPTAAASTPTGSTRRTSSPAFSRSSATTSATSRSAPGSSRATATPPIATGRARPGGSAPPCCAARWRSCWAALRRRDERPLRRQRQGAPAARRDRSRAERRRWRP